MAGWRTGELIPRDPMDESSPAENPKRRRTRTSRIAPKLRRAWLPPGVIRYWAPVAIFVLLLVLAPLLFGAVDRIVQVFLLVFLAAGLFLRPPALVPLGRTANVVITLLLAVLLLKEFAPWRWFGETIWRRELAASFNVPLPATHHPEPFRAVDALLAGVVGLLWFQWVRSLASERGTRRVMGWVMFAAGLAVAVVCLAMGRREVSAEGGMIYGLRFTTSWAGWGPFPNRNHTADLLAMSMLIGAGCIAWAVVKRRKTLVVAGVLAFLVIGAALIASGSRGGILIAFGTGAVVFAGFVLVRFFNARTFALVTTAGVLGLTAFMLTGGEVIKRMQSHEAGGVSNDLRVAIWRDTFAMWKDAPLFGHGLETFAQLFSSYQTVALDGARAVHPESSVLLWMAELGAVPLGIAVIAFLIFVGTNMGAVLERRGAFFISLGALAGVAGFLAHSAIDVPAHRWGTAAFALALLAVACPVRSSEAPVPPSSRRASVVPLAVAGFWVLPMLVDGAAWSPLKPVLLLERENWFAAGGGKSRPPRPPLAEWHAVAKCFPLDWEVQQTTGMRELEAELPLVRKGKSPSPQWQWRFDLVSRLAPGLYGESMKQAYVTAQISKGLAMGYWQKAVDAAGHDKNEVLRTALRETASFPDSEGVWTNFCLEHPELLPVFAALMIEDMHRSPASTRFIFDVWWERRSTTGAFTDDERGVFHRYGHHWATLEQVGEWVKLNAARRKLDYRNWAALIHKLGDSVRAWEILSGVEKEPGPIDVPRSATVASMRDLMSVAPDNFSNIASLASFLDSHGQSKEARSIVLATAQRPGAPKWFLLKSAYGLAAEGRHPEAVELMMRIK
jgi:O-antigen ligase